MIELTAKPISVDKALSEISRVKCGAVVAFIGIVRPDFDGKRNVSFLEIEPVDKTSSNKLEQIVLDIKSQWPVHDVIISRRTGRVKAGENALIVVISAVHRHEAFEACQYAIDKIKEGKITTELEIYN